jgi:hypothetical protein
MSGLRIEFVKMLEIARRLLLANRWLWMLLVLWPWVMAAILSVGGDGLAEQDVAALLEQEGLYGLALVAFTGGALLGNEQRSRRIVMVLARAVGRSEYLLALVMTTAIPLLLYGLSLVLAGRLLGAPAGTLLRYGIAEMLLGIPLSCIVIFWSIWLPGVLAAMVSLALVSALLWVPGLKEMMLAAQLRLFLGDLAGSGAAVSGLGLRSSLAPLGGVLLGATIESLLAAGLFFVAAARAFRRRDLELKGE